MAVVAARNMQVAAQNRREFCKQETSISLVGGVSGGMYRFYQLGNGKKTAKEAEKNRLGNRQTGEMAGSK
jgi:hypothetical protein